MSTSPYWIRMGGQFPLTEIAAHSAPTWETWADGGNGPASWEMSLTAKFEPNLLRAGTRAEIMVGCTPVNSGRIEDYNRSTGEVVTRGIQTDAARIPALDGSGNATRDFTTALATAVAAPWRWRVSNPNNITGSAKGDDGAPMMMSALLDQLAEQAGARWGTEADNVLYLRADPAAPTWLISPEAAAFGTTDEGVATHLVGRYFDGTNNVTLIVGNPSAVSPSAEIVDLTSRGALSAADAGAILNAALGARGSRPAWINGVTLGREQITNMGGSPALLCNVRAGSMARAHGFAAINYSIASLSTQAVIGKTRYTAGAETIYLEPVNTAPRTLTDVLAAA